MDRRTKHTLTMSLGIVFVLLMVVGMFYLGGVIRPVWVLIICEFLFSFVVIPRFLVLYYKLYKSRVRFFPSIFVPIYNTTLAMSRLLTNLIIGNVVVIILLGLMTMNAQFFNVGDVVFFLKFVDFLNYGLFIAFISLFILTGFGLASVHIKISNLYKLGFDNSDVKYGFYKFVDLFLTSSSFLATIFFALPVIRILPALLMMEKCSELAVCNITFYDYYDYDEEEYEEEDYE